MASTSRACSVLPRVPAPLLQRSLQELSARSHSLFFYTLVFMVNALAIDFASEARDDRPLSIHGVCMVCTLAGRTPAEGAPRFIEAANSGGKEAGVEPTAQAAVRVFVPCVFLCVCVQGKGRGLPPLSVASSALLERESA